MLNWRPVYDIEQETERLRQEVEQLKASNARIDRFERELFSSSTPTPFTDDSSPT
jgi:chorismate mutase